MFGRLQVYIIGGIILFGAISGIYYSWRKSIEREALLKYNQAQIEQNIKDQEAMREKLKVMEDKQKEIEAQNAADKKDFRTKMDSIVTDVIDTSKTVDRPSSDVLKQTVSRLKDVPK